MARKPNQRDDVSWTYLAPVDLREHDLPVQAALGFHRGRTEELLNRAADTIERLNRELVELREATRRMTDERTGLEHQITEEKARAERLVGEAILDAHKAAQALRAEAETEAETLRAEAEEVLVRARREENWLVAEARVRAQDLVADAEAECKRLATQAEQYRLLVADVHRRSESVLRTALEALREGSPGPDLSGEEVAPFRKTGREAAAE